MKVTEVDVDINDGEIERIVDFAYRRAVRFVNKGRLPGSLEPEETAGLDYYVVSGDIIKKDLSWLWEKYQTEWMSLVSTLTGAQCQPCAVDTISVNINVLKDVGARYEWHVDSDPYSGVLFLTDRDEDEGGEFVIEVDGIRRSILPQRKKMVVFDGAACPHGVNPLKTPRPRVTLVFVFLDPARAMLRGSEEEQYSMELYGHT